MPEVEMYTIPKTVLDQFVKGVADMVPYVEGDGSIIPMLNMLVLIADLSDACAASTFLAAGSDAQ